MVALEQFRSHHPGFADLLNWAALIDDGIVQCKDGAFLAGFYYQSPDVGYASSDERNQTTHIVNRALADLESGWVLWSDVIRLPASAYPDKHDNYFPDLACVLIDDERRKTYEAEGEHFVSQHAMLVMFTPPKRTERRLRNLGEIKNPTAPQTDKNSWPDEQLVNFKQALRDLLERLGSVLNIDMMGSYEIDGVLHDSLVDYLSFVTIDEPAAINIPPGGMYLDALIAAGSDLSVGVLPSVNKEGREEHIATIAITGLPSSTWPNMLTVLETMPTPCRWSTRMIMLSKSEAIGEISRYRRRWLQKTRGFFSQVFQTQGGPINEDALLMAGEADGALTDANSDLVRFGYYTSVVVMRDTDSTALMERARLVRKRILAAGCLARIETLNAVEAWLGTLPGHPHPNIRRPLIHTLNLADLLPLSRTWSGEANCPNPLYPPSSPPLMLATAVGSTPFRVNLHVNDVGHTLIFGPTGSGKSTLLCMLCAQFRRYRDAKIFAFDQGRSMETLVKACGGTHYNTGSDGTELAPLSALETPLDFEWVANWLGELFELQHKKKPSTEQKEAIRTALNLLKKAAPHDRSLTEFTATVQNREVRSAVEQYCFDDSILDGKEDTLSMSDFVVIEVDDLLHMPEEQTLLIFSYLFKKFESSLEGAPGLLVLGEAWSLLAHPTFQPKIREWLKTLRKANCTVIIETQSLSDAAESGLFDVLLESCPTKILLPNPAADQGGSEKMLGPKDYYVSFGLNEADIRLIKEAIPKRQYYQVSPLGRRLWELELGPIAKALVAVSDKESLGARQRLEDKHKEKWLGYWLENQGLAGHTLNDSAKTHAKAKKRKK